VEYGAVQGGTGLKNPECSVKLQNVTKQAGVTSEPDLVAVGNFGSLGNHADFTFDDPVRVGNQTSFELILDGGLRVNSTAATVSSNDSKTVTAIFPGLPSGKTIANIVRAVVLSSTTAGPGAVQGQQDVGDPRFSNPLESVNLPPGNGKTVLADLVSAAVSVQSGTITYTFDQAISTTITPGNFQAYDSGANLTTTAHVVVSGSNSVVATFGPGLANDPPVLAAVFRGAVKGTGALPKGSTDASVPLQTVVFQAGTTQLPDLQDVSVSTTSTGHKMVTFTFDSALPFAVGNTAPAADFHLYDAAAKQYTSSSSGFVNPGGKSVSFTGPNTFADAVIGVAVVGAVDDASVHDNPGPPGFPIQPASSKFPEGCAAIH
jgi:hypothetical protein